MPVSLLSIVVFLPFLFVIIIIHGEDTFDCTGYEDDSYHPIYDADDCRHYWHCIYVNTVYMHAVRRVCPAGTEFDAALRQCETSSLVNCAPPKSPHLPRTSTTTKAWKWKYSKLFSRKHWAPTMPVVATTRRHHIFDLDEPPEVDTTTMIMPELETTQKFKVLPFTLFQATTILSLEQLSKNLNALALNHRPSKHRSAANFFQPGEPENEAEVYTSTMRRTRRTRYTTQSTSIQTTTQFPLTTFLFTTETITITTTTTTILMTTTAPAAAATTAATTAPLLTWTSTVITQPDTTINIKQQPRIGGQQRRNNMTLYILTSDEHKIRQFSINHTRGILINCNQLRRRLLGRRRLRDILITTTNSSLTIKSSSPSSIQTFHYYTLSLTILFYFFLQK